MLRNEIVQQILMAADEIGPRRMLVSLLEEMSNTQLGRLLKSSHELSPTSKIIAMVQESLTRRGVDGIEAGEIVAQVRQRVDVNKDIGEFMSQCFREYNDRKLDRQGEERHEKCPDGIN